MKVDKNGPAFPFPATGDHGFCPGIPLRLELASRNIVATLSTGDFTVIKRLAIPGGIAEMCDAMLDFADTLIERHNATCGE